ncbi:uncharacterized protein SAPINGB_P004417 [Magnusiomyces paraingens]|uniref:Endonuclease/exonuclease/phosphatase domain-containing protein n=1 Tax=Magnusiomyces paraingens TaxID=2606893 RepID=A0A5E8BZG7_9ASCO|nr:uncharacterized protein SAPINGB_P004417 [Saprochaete ingens]VVT55080.1 unnamed protein product [Saprochaete ingens]
MSDPPNNNQTTFSGGDPPADNNYTDNNNEQTNINDMQKIIAVELKEKESSHSRGPHSHEAHHIKPSTKIQKNNEKPDSHKKIETIHKKLESNDKHNASSNHETPVETPIVNVGPTLNPTFDSSPDGGDVEIDATPSRDMDVLMPDANPFGDNSEAWEYILKLKDVFLVELSIVKEDLSITIEDWEIKFQNLELKNNELAKQLIALTEKLKASEGQVNSLRSELDVLRNNQVHTEVKHVIYAKKEIKSAVRKVDTLPFALTPKTPNGTTPKLKDIMKAQKQHRETKVDEDKPTFRVCIRIPDTMKRVNIPAIGKKIDAVAQKPVAQEIGYTVKGHLYVQLNDKDFADKAAEWIPKVDPTYSVLDTDSWYKAVLQEIPNTASIEDLKETLYNFNDYHIVLNTEPKIISRNQFTQTALVSFRNAQDYAKCADNLIIQYTKVKIKKEPDILLLQEPYFNNYGPIKHKDWIPIFTETGKEKNKCRAITYIRSNSDLRALTTKIEKFTNRDMVTILVKDITIVNVYNQPKPSKKYPEPPVFEFLKREIKEQYSKIVIAGDYNLHHKEWESRAGPNTEADEVVEWLHENDMMLITPRNQKTYNNRTNIDLVYGSVDLLHRISFSGVDENTLSDHSIVEWDIYMSQSKNGDEVFTSVKRLNIKNADWEKFDKELSSAIKDFNVHNKTLKSTDQIDDQAKVLEEVVKRAMAKSMKEVKVMKKSKRYWNQELREKKEDGTLTTTVDEKRHEIWKALLPEIDHGLDREFEIDDDSRWPKLEFDEVDSALADTPNDKAPGDDGITGKVLKMAWLNKDFKERFSSFSKLV